MSPVASMFAPARVTRSCRPGSATGACAACNAATCAGIRSTPTTLNPLLARTATHGAPSLPNPTTEICNQPSPQPPIVEQNLHGESAKAQPSEHLMRAGAPDFTRAVAILHGACGVMPSPAG